MDGDKVIEDQSCQLNGSPSLTQLIDRVPQLVNIKDIHQMIDLQVATLDRLDCTNKSLANCSAMAQNKLGATSKLYKRTAKQISDSKKDLDVIYKKILDLKAKIRIERPDLFESERRSSHDEQEDQIDSETNEQRIPEPGASHQKVTE
uniref:KxDL motif-containing protein CG10681 n=1 Tax=Aceria tosichella TaxID=561515 RepID=A0A6G1S3D3_9ACAR